MSKDLTVFNYGQKEVRTLIDEKGEIWFVAKDVAEILEIVNTATLLERLDRDGVGSTDVMDSIGRYQKSAIINEPNFYRSVLRSDKPQAEPLMNWVTKEVLPNIRKTGSYSIPKEDTKVKKIVTGTIDQEFNSWLNIAKMVGLKDEQAIFSANKAVRKLTGIDCLVTIGYTAIESSVQEKELKTIEIATILKISSYRINLISQTLGLVKQYRDHKLRSKWEITEKGQQYARYKEEERSNGTGTERIIVYKSSVLPLFEEFLSSKRAITRPEKNENKDIKENKEDTKNI